MGVLDGQAVSAAVTNPAFLDANADDTALGKISFADADVVSGPTVTNIQRETNSLNSFTGRIAGSVYNALPSFVADYVGAVGDNLKQRIDALITRFSGSVGHTHDGTDGNGPLLSAGNIVGTILSYGVAGPIDALPTVGYTAIRLTNASAVTLRGIANGQVAKIVTVMNDTGFDLTVKNLFGSPVSASDRIATGTGSDLTIQDQGAILFQYDSIDSIWRTVGGPGGDAIVGFQENLAGVVDGVNAVFGPLSLTPVNTDSIIVWVDGVERNKTTWSYSSGNITLVTAPSTGQDVYVFYLYKQSGGVAPVVGVTQNPKTEYITLSSGQITSASCSLAFSPVTPSEILLDTPNGTINQYGVDFTVSGSTVSWTGLALDGVLSAGDVLRVHYYY